VAPRQDGAACVEREERESNGSKDQQGPQPVEALVGCRRSLFLLLLAGKMEGEED
jgi:hypothetical protein